MKGQRGKGIDVTLEAFKTMKLQISNLQTLTDVLERIKENENNSRIQVKTIKENYDDAVDIDYIFKASFDKANRTSMKGQRGKGLDVTLEAFRTMKLEIAGLQTLTDVHDTKQVYVIKENYNDAVDILQIPAFLCRQTDLIRACVDTGKIINIKKGQFLAPWDVGGILTKTEGAKRVWITERGTSFGYNTLVVDFTGMAYIMDNYGTDLIFDVTHSVQKPGGLGGVEIDFTYHVLPKQEQRQESEVSHPSPKKIRT